MANALACRVASMDRTPSFFRASFNFLRRFSTNPSADSSSSAAAANTTKSRRKKKKNLFEVAQFLPNWGIGYHMAKSHWTNVSYEIKKINLYKDGRHGKAWGLAYKDGVPADAPKKMSGVHKRCWRYIPNPKKAVESTTDTQGELVCEELPVKKCAFAVASSGKRCSIETYALKGGSAGFQCKTSDIMASADLREHIENDDCISSCGVQRETVGISTDNLLVPEFSVKLCSRDCQLNCFNIVDLYSNLALAEGVYLPAVCKALAAGSRRQMTQILSSGESFRRQTKQTQNSGTASTLAFAQNDIAKAPSPPPSF